MAKSFTETQYQFAAYIRDPEHKAAPDNIEQRRMAIYRDLFFNNIEGSLSNAFPVIRTLFSEEKWLVMVRDFMVRHHCKSPLFVDIAREFISYLEHERDSRDDPVFMQELAHYEWVELALSIAEPEFEQSTFDDNEDCLTLSLHKSPLAWSLVYHYPVHQIGPDNQPHTASETPVCLLVYRNGEDKIKFIELNPVSAHLIDLLDQGLTGYQAAEQIAQALQHPTPDVVTEGASQMVIDWLSRGILLSDD
jgi:hypothetical protein